MEEARRSYEMLEGKPTKGGLLAVLYSCTKFYMFRLGGGDRLKISEN